MSLNKFTDSSIIRPYLNIGVNSINCSSLKVAGIPITPNLLQGATGLKGATGIQGVTGIQGAIGIQGVTGLQGVTGTQGVTGIQGETGTQGGTGIQGETGETGISYSAITDFQLRQGTDIIATSNNLYAQKVGDMITLYIPLMTVPTTEITTSIISNATTLTEIQPITLTTVPSLVGGGIEGISINSVDQKMSISKLNNGSWSAGNKTVFPFVITYRCANSTPLNNGTNVFSTYLYPPSPPPALFTPHNIDPNVPNPNFLITASNITSITQALALFDNTFDSGHPDLTGYNSADGKANNTVFNGFIGEWIKITLDQTRSFSQYRLAANLDTIGGGLPRDFRLWGSTDDATWTSLNVKTDYPTTNWKPNDYAPYIQLGSVSYRYIVLQITRNHSPGRGTYTSANLSEIDIN